MTVRNACGGMHRNIIRLWVEKNVRMQGDVVPFHRIMGEDEGKGTFVLEWGTVEEEVMEEYARMVRHMEVGGEKTYDCCATVLRKDKHRFVRVGKSD